VQQLPFSIYDFFGCLASGFVLLSGLAAALAGTDAWQRTPSTTVAILLVVAAYATGHVIANIAGYVLEAKLVRQALGVPSERLFGSGPATTWARLVPGYFRPLPMEQQTRVRNRAARAGITSTGEGLFLHCFSEAKREPVTLDRLNTFLNLYGFCRNMCVSLAVVGGALLLGTLVFNSAKTGPIVPPGWCIAGCLLVAAGLLYRYLKFYRQYSVEVFVSYAERQDGD
jgi:hypothetical protein